MRVWAVGAIAGYFGEKTDNILIHRHEDYHKSRKTFKVQWYNLCQEWRSLKITQTLKRVISVQQAEFEMNQKRFHQNRNQGQPHRDPDRQRQLDTRQAVAAARKRQQQREHPAVKFDAEKREQERQHHKNHQPVHPLFRQQRSPPVPVEQVPFIRLLTFSQNLAKKQAE